MASLRDVERYHQQFTRLAEPLSDPNNRLMLENDVNLCFYRGIPVDVRRRIRHRIEHAHTKSNNAPPRERVYSYLKDLFDDTDIDRDIHRLQTRDELDSDSSSNEGSDDETPVPPPTPKKKKKVTFFEKDKPSEKIIPASPPTPVDDRIDQLSRQLEELVLSYAESNR
ncbi:hypothetical protein H0H87_000935, partial [Tephrocybe sp. NHM501043]